MLLWVITGSRSRYERFSSVAMLREALILLLLLLVESSSEDHSLYNTLGIEKHASAKEIKRAYHRLALKLHPDKVEDSASSDPEYMEEMAQSLLRWSLPMKCSQIQCGESVTIHSVMRRFTVQTVHPPAVGGAVCTKGV